MSRVICKLLIAIGLCCTLGGAPPAPVAGQEASAQRPQVASALAARLGKIDDPDQRAREAARRDVLSLTTSELPELRAALAELARQHRLTPGIVRLAYDVTMHAYVREAKLQFLDAQPPNVRTGEPFLGIMLGGDMTSSTPGAPAGVAVRSINPGFVAYEVLEEGDLLIAVRSHRGLERLSHFGNLQMIFQDLAPGDSVEFIIVRGGSVVRAALKLDERPESRLSGEARWQGAANEAQREAAAYWDEQIVPILPPPATPIARSE